MKSDIAIQDDIYQALSKDKALSSALKKLGFDSPQFSIEKKGSNASGNVVVISVLANDGISEIQEAFVNVNVFVQDIKKSTQAKNVSGGQVYEYIADRKKLRELCVLFEEKFKLIRGETFRVTLDSQRVLEDKDTHQHFINNKLLYKQFNP